MESHRCCRSAAPAAPSSGARAIVGPARRGTADGDGARLQRLARRRGRARGSGGGESAARPPAAGYNSACRMSSAAAVAAGPAAVGAGGADGAGAARVSRNCACTASQAASRPRIGGAPGRRLGPGAEPVLRLRGLGRRPGVCGGGRGDAGACSSWNRNVLGQLGGGRAGASRSGCALTC